MTEVYTNAKYLAATDALQWVDGGVTFRALLVTSGYSFSAAHVYVSHVAGEVVAAGYARQDVISRTVSVDYGGARAILDADDITFPTMTGVVVTAMLIYKQVGGDDSTPADDPLICYIEFGSPQTPINQSIRVEFDPDGVVELATC